MASDMDGTGFVVWTLWWLESDRGEDAGFRKELITLETDTNFPSFTAGGFHKGRALGQDLPIQE